MIHIVGDGERRLGMSGGFVCPPWFGKNAGEVPPSGIYELDLPRKWLVQAAPFLKVLVGTLGIVAPVAFAVPKLAMSDAAYKAIASQLDLGQKCFDALAKGADKATGWQGDIELEPGRERQAHDGELRQLQAWLREKDPGFGGLIRVMDKQQNFMWVHPRFSEEY